VPQTVTVTAVDDNLVEGLHTGAIGHTVTSPDPAYDALPVGPVTANITDNDIAGITVVQSSGTTDVTEGGGTDNYTVVLDAQPVADVTITLAPDSQLTTDVTTLTFTPLDWNAPQTVTVTAVDDALVEGTHSGTITQAVASADPNFGPLTMADIVATITDNDSAGVLIVESGGTTDVTEGGAGDSYDVSLTAQPSSDVTITLGPDAQVTAGPAVLTFTPLDWNVPQTVTVTAVDDAIAEGPHTGTITHNRQQRRPQLRCAADWPGHRQHH